MIEVVMKQKQVPISLRAASKGRVYKIVEVKLEGRVDAVDDIVVVFDGNVALNCSKCKAISWEDQNKIIVVRTFEVAKVVLHVDNSECPA